MTPDAKLRDELAIGYTVETASKSANAIFDANTFDSFVAGWSAKAKHEDEKTRRLVEACKELEWQEARSQSLLKSEVFGDCVKLIFEALKEFEK